MLRPIYLKLETLMDTNRSISYSASNDNTLVNIPSLSNKESGADLLLFGGTEPLEGKTKYYPTICRDIFFVPTQSYLHSSTDPTDYVSSTTNVDGIISLLGWDTESDSIGSTNKHISPTDGSQLPTTNVDSAGINATGFTTYNYIT